MVILYRNQLHHSHIIHIFIAQLLKSVLIHIQPRRSVPVIAAARIMVIGKTAVLRCREIIIETLRLTSRQNLIGRQCVIISSVSRLQEQPAAAQQLQTITPPALEGTQRLAIHQRIDGINIAAVIACTLVLLCTPQNQLRHTVTVEILQRIANHSSGIALVNINYFTDNVHALIDKLIILSLHCVIIESVHNESVALEIVGCCRLRRLRLRHLRQLGLLLFASTAA